MNIVAIGAPVDGPMLALEGLRMIDKVNIGPIEFDVVEVDDLHCLQDGKKTWLNGQIIFGDADIHVNKDLADAMKVCVIWHEALHGILEQAGIDDHPENIIRLLGYGLVRFIRDNPHLIEATVKHYQQAEVQHG